MFGAAVEVQTNLTNTPLFSPAFFPQKKNENLEALREKFNYLRNSRQMSVNIPSRGKSVLMTL